MATSITLTSAVHGEVGVGSVLTYTRRYLDWELLRFYKLGGGAPRTAEELPEHLPYLLVIAPLTKLGGDLNYLSGRMNWLLRRPVARTESLTAELEVTRLDQAENAVKAAFGCRVHCAGELVVSGDSRGLVLPGDGIEVKA